jgi:diguanylate cyclase (GGDEF)-like protein
MAARNTPLGELAPTGRERRGTRRRERPPPTLGDLRARLRDSEYVRVGASPRFRAGQRRRTVVAARIGMLVIAGAVAFDAVAMLDLDFAVTWPAVAIDVGTFAVALLGWWLLGGRLRRHPELVAGGATIGLAISTVTSGTIVPSLAVQTVAYLLVIPGLVALLLPWRTRTHICWLLGYAIVGYGYIALGTTARFSSAERGDLVVVFAVALGAGVAGHVLLQRAQIRNFTQLARIGKLRRKTESDMVELGRLHRALELTARTDPLTGAGNRRRLDEDLRVVRAHMRRSGLGYGIAEIDLDHFKGVNDRYGHAAGDDVLRRVARAIEQSLRAEDAVYRLGGEEFLVVLQTPSADGLRAAAERLRTVVLGLGIEHDGNPPTMTVSVSIGATIVGPSDLDQTDEQWIARADEGLYAAKRGGRNRVCLTVRRAGAAATEPGAAEASASPPARGLSTPWTGLPRSTAPGGPLP